MENKNEIGFGLAEVKQEGATIAFDKANSDESYIRSGRWMELKIYDDWTEEQIIEHIKDWIKEERFYGRSNDEDRID